MAVLCVYDGNKTIQYRYFNIDEDFAKDIIKKGIDWTEKYIFGDGVPPSETLEDIQIKFKEVQKGSCAHAEDSFRNIIERYNSLLKDKKNIEKEIEELKNIISVKIGGNEILNIGGIDCATLKVTKMSFFDKDRFSKDHPDEYKKYIVDKEMRVLRVKKISSWED